VEPDTLLANYQELRRYVGCTDADVERVRAVAHFVEPHLPALIDDFYAEVDRHPDARKVITGGAEQVERLKGTLRAWVNDLFTGEYDVDYVVRRWKAGWRHVEIGLSQVYTNVALSRLRDGLHHALRSGWVGDEAELFRTIRSLNKLLDLDLAVIEDAYQTEHLKRQQQTERLAAIGQVAGGIAHELRNPLNVVKTSVYYLLNVRNASKEKIAEHLHRVERQVGVADGVITALSDFAKLPLPQLQPFPLDTCLREVLEVNPLPGNVEVALDCPSDLPLVLGDQRQLAIVFGNLIRNARDAMPEGGRLSIAAMVEDGEVSVAITDTGVGIEAELLEHIAEPLFSTKARGIGLGLAITHAILDKHGAALQVNSQPGQGSTFSVTFAAAGR
jgi:signal transduction histidine kinase